MLGAAWWFHAAKLTYAPVGFGSHHWVATDPGGDRRFVTADQLDQANPDGRLARLRAAMGAACQLQERAGLGFVVAPLRAADGSAAPVLHTGGQRWAVTVFPLVPGDPLPDDLAASDRAAVTELVARLHNATPQVEGVVRDDLAIQDRAEFEAVLPRLREPWSTGPYAETARELLSHNHAELRALLAAYDQMVAAVCDRGVGWVLTHGEPKADNVLRTEAGLRLVDWETARLAPAARDLWLLDSGGAELARYAELTGRDVAPEELKLFQLRWELSDIASFTRWLAGLHARTPDTEIAFRSLSGYLRDLKQRWAELL